MNLKRLLRDFYPDLGAYDASPNGPVCTWDGPCPRSRVVDAIVIVVLFWGLCLFIALVFLQGCAAVPA